MMIDKFDEKIGTHGLTQSDVSSVWTNPTDPLPTLIFDRNQDWSEVTEEFEVIPINQIVQTLADLKYARHFTGINHSHRRDIRIWLLIIFLKNEFVFAYPSVKIIILYLYLYLYVSKFQVFHCVRVDPRCGRSLSFPRCVYHLWVQGKHIFILVFCLRLCVFLCKYFLCSSVFVLGYSKTCQTSRMNIGNSIVSRNHRKYGGSPPSLCWLWWQSTIWKLSEMVDYEHTIKKTSKLDWIHCLGVHTASPIDAQIFGMFPW